MPGLSETLSRLSSLRAAAGQPSPSPPVDRLSDLAFTDNPGALRARCYVPNTLPSGAPLVVALHGCTQNAAGYDWGTGWSRLADGKRFAVLFPEQARGNNANGCFNWFSPADTTRGSGEVASIRAMIEAMLAAHTLDRKRVFITGLSAGGAMAAAMLATYPELFASGAIIAGLPFGIAQTMPQAFEAMRGQRRSSGPQLGQAIRAAAPRAGQWPTISVWHGTGDATVAPTNGGALVDQWCDVHGVTPSTPKRVDRIGRTTHSVWCDDAGHEVVEAFAVPHMGHGVPLDPARAGSLENAGAFMLDVGISSTLHIARFWGLVNADDLPTERAARPDPGQRERPRAPCPTPQPRVGPSQGSAGRGTSDGVRTVIEDALRAAGLMK